MAKIVYGVAGEGFGHSSRTHLIGQRLIDSGHEVMFIASEKSFKYLREYFAKKVKNITGMFLVYKNRDIRILQTVISNISRFPSSVYNNFKLFKDYLAPFDPDLAITDFEPFTAYWASSNNIPLISIDHEHLLSNCMLDNINNRIAKFNSSFVIKFFRIKANAYIVLNFFETPIIRDNTFLAPPVVRQVVKEYEPALGEHILFYSTDNSNLDKLINIFNKFPNYQFVIYGFNKNLTQSNCIFKKTSTKNFIADLASSRAVIATAGFSLLSECLFFRKKMLLLPLLGQYEQLVNAHYIKKLNLGSSSYKLDEQVLGNFLNNIDDNVITDERVLRPDNDRFFEILESVLNKTGFSINAKSCLLNKTEKPDIIDEKIFA